MSGFRSSAASNTAGTWRLVDDFVTNSASSGTVGELGWAFSNGTAVSSAAISGHPGIVERITTTTANQTASLRPGSVSTTAACLFGDVIFCRWTIAAKETDADHTVRIGLWGTAAAAPTTGVYLERVAATDTSWYGVTRKDGVETRVELAAYDTTWRTFTIRRTETPSVVFQIDGVTIGASTTNLPAASDGMIPIVHIFPTSTTARSVYLDRFELVGTDNRL